jgi:ketosteroid isomerase-like protein
LEDLGMRATVLLAIVLAFPGFSFSQQPNGDARGAVETVLHQQQDAWNHHDLEGFMSGYWNSPELTFFSGAKVSSGWQSALDHYRKKYQDEGKEMGHLDFSDLNVQAIGSDAAFVRGAWELTISGGKKPHGVFTLVFRKFPEGWKIIHDHTSTAE